MKKILTAAAAGAMLAITAFAAVGVMVTVAGAATAAQDTVVRIDAKGVALVRGTISGMSADSLTVRSWGGDWTVNVLPGAQVLPNITGNDLANFQVGDYVGAQGTVRSDANWTVDAALVRDWTYRDVKAAEKKQNQQTASQTIKANTPKNYAGVASGVSNGAFSLAIASTTGTATLAVDVLDGAQVVNRNWIAMPVEAISNGDSVRVWGVNTGGTIGAQIVRDLSLPATSTAQ